MIDEKLRYKLQHYSIFSMLLSAIIFTIGNVIAIMAYPNYSFSNNYFSDLGIRSDIVIPDSNEVAKAAPHPEIFNITLYLAGLFIIPFFPAAYFILRDTGRSTKLFALSGFSGVFLGPLLIGVGIYDVASNFELHVELATDLMFMVGLTSIFWSLGVVKLTPSSPYKVQNRWQIDPIFTMFILVVSWILVWGRPAVILLEDIPYEVYQKMVALSFIPFFSFVGLRLLKINTQLIVKG